MYTQFCRELASQGAIVLAIEHEDGSGIYAISGKTGQPIEYVKRPRGTGEEVFRQPFLHKRNRELTETIGAILDFLNGDDVVLGQGKEENAMADVLRCADPTQLFLVGHSFGASGIVRYCGQLGPRGPQHPLRGVVLLDIWTASLPRAELEKGLKVPFVHLLSDGWQVDHCCHLSEASDGYCLGAAIVRGTKHTWVSDSQLFAPAWILRLIGYTGKGSYPQCLGATVRAAWRSLQILADVETASRGKFVEGLAAVDAGILAVIWPSEAPAAVTEAWCAP